MREPHDIEIRITAYNHVIEIIKENIDYYEYRLKYHNLEGQEKKQVEHTIDILKTDVSVNEAMILSLKDDLDKALDKEVRGW